MCFYLAQHSILAPAQVQQATSALIERSTKQTCNLLSRREMAINHLKYSNSINYTVQQLQNKLADEKTEWNDSVNTIKIKESQEEFNSLRKQSKRFVEKITAQTSERKLKLMELLSRKIKLGIRTHERTIEQLQQEVSDDKIKLEETKKINHLLFQAKLENNQQQRKSNLNLHNLSINAINEDHTTFDNSIAESIRSNHKLNSNTNKRNFTKVLFKSMDKGKEELCRNNAIKEKERNSECKLEKIKRYSKILKELHMPTIDITKRKEIIERNKQLNSKGKPIRETANINYKLKPWRRYMSKQGNKQAQETNESTPKYANYLEHFRSQTIKRSRVDNFKLNRIFNNSQMSPLNKFDYIKKQLCRISKRIETNELCMDKSSINNINFVEDASECYFNAIQAKLFLLNNFSKS